MNERAEQLIGAIGRLGAVAAVLGLGITAAAAGQRQEYPWQQMGRDTFTVAAGGTLSVRVDDADVAIRPTTSSDSTVTFQLRSNDMEWATERFERTHYRARVDGDTIVIESDREPRDSWVSGNWMSVLVEIEVPARFDLDVVTQDGDITAGAFEGNAVLRSQDGDITVDSLSGTTIELRTQDGDVRAAELAAGTVTLRSQDGDLEVDALRGAVTAHTQDGDIRFGTADAPQLDLETGDGDIFVAITRAARMQLDTHDGDISIEAPATLQADIDLRGEDVHLRGIGSLSGNVSGRRARGSINGGGERIVARSGDGTVRLIGRDER